jgi:hypothetical protein
MPHTTEIVRWEKKGNAIVEYVIRCCGNASTDWAHPMAVSVASDPDKKKSSLDEARQKCAALHEQAQQAELAALDDVGTTVEHQ